MSEALASNVLRQHSENGGGGNGGGGQGPYIMAGGRLQQSPRKAARVCPPDFLPYPWHFFPGGKLPSSGEAALQWKWRENRQASAAQEDAPDGPAMLREMTRIRNSLRTVTTDSFHEGMITYAGHYGLRLPDCDQVPKNKDDVKSALRHLVDCPQNHLLFWRICHANFGYGWATRIIDNWMKDRQMFLLESDRKKDLEKRQFTNCRGGFSIVVTDAKQQAFRPYWEVLYKAQGWKIGVKGPPKDKDTGEFLEEHKGRKFTKLTIGGTAGAGVKKEKLEFAWLIRDLAFGAAQANKLAGRRAAISSGTSVLNPRCPYNLVAAAESLNKKMEGGGRIDSQCLLQLLEENAINNEVLGTNISMGADEVTTSTMTQESFTRHETAADEDGSPGSVHPDMFDTTDKEVINAAAVLANAQPAGPRNLEDPFELVEIQQRDADESHPVSVSATSTTSTGENESSSDDGEMCEDELYAAKAPVYRTNNKANGKGKQMHVLLNVATKSTSAKKYGLPAPGEDVRPGYTAAGPANAPTNTSDMGDGVDRNGGVKEGSARPEAASKGKKKKGNGKQKNKKESGKRKKPAPPSAVTKSPSSRSPIKSRSPPSRETAVAENATTTSKVATPPPPPPPSPPKKVCRHDDYEAGYTDDDNGNYYKADYLEKDKRKADTCAKCSGKFGVDCIVRLNHPIHLCCHAKAENPTCKHAICDKCWKKIEVEKDDQQQQGVRRRLRRRKS